MPPDRREGGTTHVELGGSIFFRPETALDGGNSGASVKTRLISLNIQDLDPEDAVPVEVRVRVTSRRERRLASAARLSLLSLLFILPVFVHAGFFNTIFGMMGEAQAEEEVAEQSYTAQNVPLLRAAVHSDPNSSKGGGDVVVDESGALVPSLGPSGSSGTEVENNGEISIHVVRPCTEGHCETLSHIAEMYGVSVNTILWANEIKNPKTIQPGDELLILPISGVRHIVKSGDSLKSITKKYHPEELKAEEMDAIMAEIIDYNRLASATDLTPGATIVIPGGEVAVPIAPKSSTAKGGSAGGSTATGGYFAKPLKSYTRTQGIHGYNGVDLAAPVGTSVYASAGGTVIVSKSSGWNGGYGNYIVIKHPNGTQTLYAHLSSVGIGAGATVAKGDYIGAVGNTGRSTGSHLHFEVRGARNPF